VLNIWLFVLGNYLSSTTMPGATVSNRKRLQTTYTGIDLDKLIKNEIEGRTGSTVISCKSCLKALVLELMLKKYSMYR